MIPVRPALQQARERVEDLRERRRDAGNRRGRSYAFAALTPVRHGHAGRLARLLRGFENNAQSPLARVPSVHFARWVVIDQLRTDWPGVPRPVPRLNSQYLLFTADVTAPDYDGYQLPWSFLEELVTYMPEAQDVWSHCEGYPDHAGPDDLVAYLADSQVDTALYFVAHPGVSVGEIQDALRERRDLIDFVKDHQTATAEDLQREYLQEAARWFRST